MHAWSRVAWFAMNMYIDREPGYVSPEGDLGYYNNIDPDCIVSFSSKLNLLFFIILKYEIVLFYSFINLNFCVSLVFESAI